jgi:hypothetical protein
MPTDDNYHNLPERVRDAIDGGAIIRVPEDDPELDEHFGPEGELPAWSMVWEPSEQDVADYCAAYNWHPSEEGEARKALIMGMRQGWDLRPRRIDIENARGGE